MASRPARTATCGSPRTPTRAASGASRRGRGHGVRGRWRRQRPVGDRRRPGRQRLVHRDGQGRPHRSHHARRQVDRVHDRPDDGSAPPTGIAPGPDGNLWFTEQRRPGPHRPHHARRRHHGVPAGRRERPARATSPPAPTATSGSPVGGSPGRLGRITPAGVVTLFPALAAGADPVGIVAGPDGALYVAQRGRARDRAGHDGRRRHRARGAVQPGRRGSRSAPTVRCGAPRARIRAGSPG